MLFIFEFFLKDIILAVRITTVICVVVSCRVIVTVLASLKATICETKKHQPTRIRETTLLSYSLKELREYWKVTTLRK